MNHGFPFGAEPLQVRSRKHWQNQLDFRSVLTWFEVETRAKLRRPRFTSGGSR